MADDVTQSYQLNQVMLRIKDPEKSLHFYTQCLGMTLLDRVDFSEAKFSLFFLCYVDENSAPVPTDPAALKRYILSQSRCVLELTHNWGTESEADFSYHHGNSEPWGFGHIGVSVPDVKQACDRLAELGVPFVKKPDEGRMKGLAFVQDPDGYWVEIFSPHTLGENVVV